MNICKVYFDDTVHCRSVTTAAGELNVKYVVNELREQGAYRYIGLFNTELEGVWAAEEMFDLSNNPNRDAERRERWGTNRSLSVGDIVQVNDDCYVCEVAGWHKV